MSTGNDRPSRPRGITGVAIPAGLLIGLGIGLLVGNVAAFMLIGLGAGFVCMMVLRMITGDW